MNHSVTEGTSFAHLAAVLARRWLSILMVAALVGAAALLVSLQQDERYEATSKVLVSRQNFSADLTDAENPALNVQAERVVQTEADLAVQPAVAQATLRAVRPPGMSLEDLRDAVSVVPRDNADIIEFTVSHADPELAVALASAYAEQFKLYRRELLAAPLRRAKEELASQITELKESGTGDSTLYKVLLDKEQELRVQEALLTSNIFVIDAPQGAEQTQPKPLRNSFVGVILGLFLGGALALMREAFNTRLRTAEEIGDILALPLLARIPVLPRWMRRSQALAMVAEPHGISGEPYRVLRTNLEFANIEQEARIIQVTSALEGEGKSTTISNLAIAFAHAGRRVILVDLDLRRPAIDRLFGIARRPGATDVLLGRVSLDKALVPIADISSTLNGAGPLNGKGARAPYLRILPAGSIPPNPSELMGSRATAEMLTELSSRADVVLVDGPPMLGLDDALAASAFAQGLLVVTRLRTADQRAVTELRRLLDTSPVRALGFVVTGTGEISGYGYRYGAYQAGRSLPVEVEQKWPT
jgi:polysaccharide biosynthesis transport protein